MVLFCSPIPSQETLPFLDPADAIKEHGADLKLLVFFYFNQKSLSILPGFNLHFAARLELGRDPTGGSFV